jgi:prepilin-type N-terminal cleavage/methylation domain-containing protein
MTDNARPQGFTLVETLVAVLLLALSIAGPLTIASRGILTASIARDQITAFYLAQDAMEYVRYVRDSNTLRSSNWLTGTDSLAACISADGTAQCYVDTLQPSITPPTTCSGTCPVLNYDAALKSYRYASGTRTPQGFTRSISIKNDGVSGEATIVVQVTWRDANGAARSPVVIKENIFQWQ